MTSRILFLILLLGSLGSSAQAVEGDVQGIPKAPSAPKPLKQYQPEPAFRCEREFMYQGKLLQCDSYVRRDAEGLRPILTQVPAAVAELDAYQATRRSVRDLAYVSSLGLVAIIAGLIIDSPPWAQGTINPGGYFVIGGAGLTGFSFLYSLSLSQSNEKRLAKAIELHNQARPETPIVLQFSTNLGF